MEETLFEKSQRVQTEIAEVKRYYERAILNTINEFYTRTGFVVSHIDVVTGFQLGNDKPCYDVEISI